MLEKNSSKQKIVNKQKKCSKEAEEGGAEPAGEGQEWGRELSGGGWGRCVMTLIHRDAVDNKHDFVCQSRVLIKGLLSSYANIKKVACIAKFVSLCVCTSVRVFVYLVSPGVSACSCTAFDRPSCVVTHFPLNVSPRSVVFHLGRETGVSKSTKVGEHPCPRGSSRTSVRTEPWREAGQGRVAGT